MTFMFDKLKLGVGLGIAFIFASVMFESVTVVPAGMRGVQVTFGEVNMTPLTNGMHLVNPLSSIKNINIQLQRATMDSANAGTKDLQQVKSEKEKYESLYVKFWYHDLEKTIIIRDMNCERNKS